jgi:hypothetical protein
MAGGFRMDFRVVPFFMCSKHLGIDVFERFIENNKGDIRDD